MNEISNANGSFSNTFCKNKNIMIGAVFLLGFVTGAVVFSFFGFGKTTYSLCEQGGFTTCRPGSCDTGETQLKTGLTLEQCENQ